MHSDAKQRSALWMAWAVLSLLFAGAANAESFYHNIWYDLFAPRMGLVDLVDYLILPLWVSCTIMAFAAFPPPRKRLWWLLVAESVVLSTAHRVPSRDVCLVDWRIRALVCGAMVRNHGCEIASLTMSALSRA